MTKLRVFYLWAVRMGETTTNPFANYSIKEQIYGRPYFLTLEERDRVYNFPMPNNPFLAIQRDIFVFQCMIGCRVSDLYRLTRENINDGAIEYVPTKTKGDNQEYARVPLTKKRLKYWKSTRNMEDVHFSHLSLSKNTMIPSRRF